MTEEFPPDDTRLREKFLELSRLGTEDRAPVLEHLEAESPELAGELRVLLAAHDDPATQFRTEGIARAQVPLEHETPRRVGPFEIMGVLGRGGSSVVYRARQTHPQREVALKLLGARFAFEESIARFEREAAILGKLRHPGIAQIYASGRHEVQFGALPYFAMELVLGTPITDYAERLELTVRDRCELLIATCAAVQHAHENGIVHRDLKPSNILVAEFEDGEATPKVLDFGIARVAAEDSELRTATGQFLGTLPYMSPEQIGGKQELIDARTDVYALGVLAYELFTGQLPFDLHDRPLADALRIVENDAPARITQSKTARSTDLDTITRCALAKNREERYPSARAMGEDLRRYLRHEPIRARRPSSLYRARKFVQRNAVLSTSIALVISALSAALVLVGSYARDNATLAVERERARSQLARSHYASQMIVASRAVDSPTGYTRVQQVLERTASDPDMRAMRGFEWALLAAMAGQRNMHHNQDLSRVYVLPDRSHAVGIGAGGVWRFPLADPASRKRIGSYQGFAFSSVSLDGSTVAVHASQTALKILDLPSGKLRSTIEVGHQNLRPALSPDGTLVCAPINQAKEIGHVFRVFDTTSGEMRAQLSNDKHRMAFRSSFAPDGSMLAMAYTRGIQLWDTASWKALRQVEDGIDWVCEVAWSPDSKHVAGGDRHGKVFVWRASDGALVSQSQPHGDWVTDLCWHPDALHVTSASRDHDIVHTHIESGRVRRMHGHLSSVSSLCWSPDASGLWSTGTSDGLRNWPATAATPHRVHKTGAKAIPGRGLVWSRDGLRLGLVQIVEHVLYRKRPAQLRDAKPDEVEVFTSKRSKTVLDPAHGERIFEDLTANGRNWAIALHPDETCIAFGKGDCVRVRSIDKGVELAILRTRGRTTALDWHPNGKTLAIAESGSTAIRLWQPFADGETCSELVGHSAHPWSVEFSPDGRRIASAGRDRSLRVWDSEHRLELLALDFDEQVRHVAWHPGGKRLAAMVAGGDLHVFDARQGYDALER